MSYGTNNSKNIANLLKYEALEPINNKRSLPAIAPTNQVQQQQPPSRDRQDVRYEIPIEEVFTPEEQQRPARRKTPHYDSRGMVR